MAPNGDKQQTKQQTKVELYTTFTFGHYSNATNVAMALSSSGYLVNITPDGTSYRVDIYKRI